ncbi:unnamed protein product, partial [Gulo gulo]
RGLLLVPVPDLDLQLCVGLLQGPHLVQVGGQPVVEVLHGGLLPARQQPVDGPKAATITAPRAEAPKPAPKLDPKPPPRLQV